VATAEDISIDELVAGLDDGWEGIRQLIIGVAGEDGEWAGYPLPIDHAKLVIEPSHPLYDKLNDFSLADEPDRGDAPTIFPINHWHDRRRERHVLLYHEGNGRVKHHVWPVWQSTRRSKMVLDTLGASQAWSVRAELTAMLRLKTLVKKAAFRYYLLTGTFLETSPRSKVIYLFRKGRPTLAIKGTLSGNDTKVLCALCLHPIGFYDGTFAGSMVPTDDLIAHLLMMRGDERKFWSKCNQHDIRDAEAGV